MFERTCFLHDTFRYYSQFSRVAAVWCRWSAYVVDGKVKAFNVEEAPSDFKVSGGETILGQI